MERVITVGLQRKPQTAAETQSSLEELRRLTETAGGRVLETYIQKKDRPDPATYIGKGKAEELAKHIQRLNAQILVIDEELKPVQQRNLEDLMGAKVIDRTRLILDIFAQRARTREGMLQVELAQLEYFLPRITERFGRFEQQTGGIGTRGPGERKLEVDRRRIRDRIAYLAKQIEKIRQERLLQRTVRRSVPVPQVAIIGYTNAGKSTLLNSLLRLSAGSPHAHKVYADDKLFATLDPTTRRVRLPTGQTGLPGKASGHTSGRIILFSDTVGFIRKLPTELIAAFRATLEEAGTADLLLHVVDASDPDWEAQAETVLRILHSLHLSQLPRLTAYNKMDRLSSSEKEFFLRQGGTLLSAESGKGISELLKAIETQLASQWVEKEFLIPYSEGAQLAKLHNVMEIQSQIMTEDGIRVQVRAHPSTLAQYGPLFKKSR